ncbi:MAG: hypothetical protein US42_C0005G0034 [Candidatus Magasanikbacteria bacterium GW2011_GWC2_37_14]|uniref:Uncharacterized protein n=1 Tax=Candidatus Magasanikbacteria bacterium GW2011_GWC2_37_14 TaxID=1619046 RepID=A0A0G0IUG8_9BACT|nr:MAG: hypothetical protein US42_C0005G0034 [Candidatus Magasanikbacteria bacterium GW2011_GWC2_37_14]
MKKYFFFLLIFSILFSQFFSFANAEGSCVSDSDCDLNEECVGDICAAKFCTSDDDCLVGGAKCIGGVCDVESAVAAAEGGGSATGPKSVASGVAESGGYAPTVSFKGLDQRCWVKEKCIEAEGAAYGANTETITACGGEKNAVGEELVFCKPPYVAQTEVTFGNTNTFANMGEFIKYMFRYAIIVAGVVAVIMVIFAGIQWTISGGNAEKISSARKKIGGAMMGLFLIIMSYSILSFINPYLVNLRLPQAWMINTQGLAPVYCDFLSSSTTVATAYPYGTKKTILEKQQMSTSVTYNVNSQVATCGTEYFVKDTGGQTCSGNACPSGQLCSNFSNGEDLTPKCVTSKLAGRITGTFSVFRAPAVDKSDNEIELLALCKADANKIVKVATIKYEGSTSDGDPYFFDYLDKLDSACSDYGGPVGFYLGVEVNDETEYSGSGWVEGAPWTYGTDDWFAIGQSSPNSHNCSVNLAKVFQQIYAKQIYCGPGNLMCTCAYLSQNKNPASAALSPDFIKHLISLEELKKGYVCHIDISRRNFPSAENGMQWPTLGSVVNGTMAGAATGAVLGTFFPAPGVATLAGGVAGGVKGAVIVPAVQILSGLWNYVDDPTSCQDKN